MTYLTDIQYIKGHMEIGIKLVFIKVYYIDFPSRIRIFPSDFLDKSVQVGTDVPRSV